MGSAQRSPRLSPAPAGRKSEHHTQASTRPRLHVVEQGETQDKQRKAWRHVMQWTKTRTAPLVQVGLAVVFLLVCMLGALVLRTQMVQNSFTSSQLQQNIMMLKQDVESDQTKLDALEASLPQRARDLDMVPSQSSVTIDLQGYKPPAEGDMR